MRTLLTTLAIIVILVLTAALVVPAFVDWSKHQKIVEAQLSHWLGQSVRIAGPIELRLLPSPRLDISDVRIGNAPETLVTAKRIRAEMAVADLLRGEFAFSDLTIERAALRLTRTGRNELDWLLADVARGRTVRIDRLKVREAVVSVADAISGVGFPIENLSLDAEISTLSGPFRGSGAVRTTVGPLKFRFSAGETSRQRMPIKAVVEDSPGVPHMVLDGFLRTADGSPSFQGRAEISGKGGPKNGLPWTLTGALDASVERARLSGLDLRIGSDRHFMAATGSADLSYGAAIRTHATLRAKTIDLDRQFGGAGADAVLAPRTALTTLGQIFDDAAWANLPRVPLALDFAAGLVSVGGDALRNVNGSIAFTPGLPLVGRVSASGPGDSRIGLEGTFDVGITAKFQGHLDLAATEWPRFVEWAGQGDSRTVRSFEAFVPFRNVSLQANAEIAAGAFALQDIGAKVDRSGFTGTLAFTAPVGEKRARLSAYLTFDALDIDHLPELGALAMGKGDLDLALDLTARTARVVDIGATTIDAGRIDLKLDRTGNSTVLDHLRVAGLGGASIDAAGRLDPSGGTLQARLDAADLEGFAALLRRFLPEGLGGALAGRAGALSPTRLDVKLRAAANLEPKAIAVEGTLGETKVGLSLDRGADDVGDVNAALKLDARDGGRLLRQLGLPKAETGIGAGTIDVAAKGPWAGALEASLTAKLAGTTVTWRGRAEPAASALDGEASVRGRDLAPLLRSLGIVGADAPAIATDVTAEIEVQDGRLALRRLIGRFADIKVGGHLAWTPWPRVTLPKDTAQPASTSAAQLEGALSVDKATLANLFGMVLGPPPKGSAGSGWPTRTFAPVTASLPRTHLSVQVATLDVGMGVARAAPLDLQLKPGEMTLSLAPSAFRGGKLGGRTILRRSGNGVSLSGKLNLVGVGVTMPFVRAKLDAGIDFASTGDSPRALVAGLAGQGRAVLADAQLPKADTGALDRTIVAVDKESVQLEPAALDGALRRETGRGGVLAARLDLPLLLAAGDIRFGPATVPARRAQLEVSGQLDLAAQTVELSETIVAAAAPEDWLGPPPRLAVTWTGPWTAPVRRLDASAFFNGLSARALTINLRKLEEFDADVRERAFFNRRLKVIREHAAEEKRIADAKAAEERRRREEERATEAKRLEEILRSTDVPPAVPPKPPPPQAAPRPGG